VILPSKNRRDVEEVPADVRDKMEFIFADDMSQVLEAALEAPVTTTIENTVYDPTAGSHATSNRAAGSLPA